MYSLGAPVYHIFSKRKGVVVANGNDSPHVVVEFADGSEVVHEAELQHSDHLINPAPHDVADRLNFLIEDTSTREVASKELGLSEGHSVMNVEFISSSGDMELTCMDGTKVSLRKISFKQAKLALTNIENKVS